MLIDQPLLLRNLDNRLRHIKQRQQYDRQCATQCRPVDHMSDPSKSSDTGDDACESNNEHQEDGTALKAHKVSQTICGVV